MANELCECGCGREADTVSRFGCGRFNQMPGLWYRSQCWELFRNAAYDCDPNSDGNKMERARGQFMDRVRARRAALATGVEPVKLVEPGVGFIRERDKIVAELEKEVAKMWGSLTWETTVHADWQEPKPAAAATCATCSSPATCGEHCVYCARRAGVGGWDQRIHMRARPEDKAAAKRLALMDRREAKRPTATDRENAKGHPWDCGGEDEP